MSGPERPSWYDDAWNAYENVLFVEGKDDATLFRRWIEVAAGGPAEHDVQVIDVTGGNHLRVRQALEWRLALGKHASGIFDRDDLTDEEAALLEAREWSQGRLKVLPRFTIENYLLEPGELWGMLPEHDAVTEAARTAYKTKLNQELERYLHHCSLWKVMVANKAKLKDLRVSDAVDPVLASADPPDKKVVELILRDYASKLDQNALLAEYDKRHMEAQPASGESTDACCLRRLCRHVHGKKAFEMLTQPYLQDELKLQPEPKGWKVTLSQGVKVVPEDLKDFLSLVRSK